MARSAFAEAVRAQGHHLAAEVESARGQQKTKLTLMSGSVAKADMPNERVECPAND